MRTGRGAGVDATQKRVYRHRTQGAAFGHTRIQGKSLLGRGLNAPAATISTPLAAAWLTCAAIAHNLLRVAGALASLAYGKARGATIRRDLIDVAARTARHGRGHVTLHLPAAWYREHEWMTLFTATCGPPQQRPDQPDPGHCTLHGPGSPPSRPPNTNPGQATER